MEELPSRILQNIFMHLTLVTKFVGKFVCKRWNRLLPPFQQFDMYACILSTEDAYIFLDILKWGLIKCPTYPATTYNVCYLAAQNNRIDILQSENIPKFVFQGICGEMLFKIAVQKGNFEMLKSLRSSKCQWGNGVCQEAAHHNRLDVLKWLRFWGCPWGVLTCINAACRGHFELLKWAHKNGCPLNSDVCTMAVRGGHMNILLWLRSSEVHCPWDHNTYQEAVDGNMPTFIKYMRDNGLTYGIR